jgi:hypothetical protein
MRRDLALKDLRRLVDVSPVRIGLSDLGGDPVGLYSPDDKLIVLDEGLRGAGLYRVLLHELGHHLGLEHSSRGIMYRHPRSRSDMSEAEPTDRQRRRWCLEIAALVLRHRARKIAT